MLCRNLLLLATAVLSAGAVGLLAAESALAPGKAMAGSVAVSDARSFTLGLRAGEYIEVTVQQQRVDLALRIYSPDGKLALAVDSPNGFFGPECVSWIANVTGPHRLEVVALQRLERGGPFTLRPSRLRSPTTADHARAAGLLEVWRADQARATRKPESLTQAADLYTSAAARFGVARWRFGQAAAWQGLAATEGLRGRRQQAIHWANEAAQLFHRIKQPSAEVFASLEAGAQHFALGDHREAIAIYERALLLARRQRDLHQEGVCLNRIANSHLATSRLPEAESGFKQAAAAFRTTGERVNEARNLSSLGVLHNTQGNPTAALAAYEQALALFESAGNQRELPRLYNNLGVIARSVGEFERALRYYDSARALAAQLKDPLAEAQAWANLAAAHAELEQPQRAEPLLRNAIATARQLNQRNLERTALLRLSGALQSMGRADEARVTLESAVALAKTTQNRDEEAFGRERLGLMLAKRGQFDEALREVQESVRMRTGNRRREYLSQCALSRVYLLRAEARQAVTPASLCATGSMRLGDRATEAHAFTLLMQAWRTLDRLSAAIFFGKQAINRLQEIRANVSQIGAEDQQRYAEGKSGTYRELADLLISQGRLLEARQVLGLLKEEEYFDLLRRDPRTASGVAGRVTLTEDEQKASTRLTSLGPRRDSLLAKTIRSREEETELQALDKQFETAQREFVLVLDQLADDFVAKPQAVRVQQIREAQGMMDDLRDLPAGAAAIYTLVAPNRLHLILVTPSLQKAYETAIDSTDLAKRILDFRAEIEKPQGDPRPTAQRLFETLVPPALKADLDAAGVQTLMWSLDGALRYLPLAALYDGERYLVERYRLAVFTLASQGRLKDAPKSAWRVAGLGVSAAFEGLPALPQVPFELRGIVKEEGRATGVMPGVLMLDQAFTRDALLSTRQRFPVLHIASHFHFQPGSGAESYLLLGDGSKFSLQDLRSQTNLFSQVDLVTLSACNTGVGDGRGDGREVESFAVLAQRQGAKAVVASLWSVADGSTAELMKQFYGLRQSGHLTKVEAMRRAQLALLRGNETQWRHPYFWAPFFVVGNWQ